MKSVFKLVRLTVVTVVLVVQASSAYGDCWRTTTVNCQYGGPQFFVCDDVSYPILSFINSGTYELAALAYDGLDGKSDATYNNCTWEYTFICDGIMVLRGPTAYPQDGSHASGRRCMLALLRQTVRITLGIVARAW